MSDLKFLETLETIIRERLAGAAPESYTARLAAEGLPKVAQKLGEEGLEVALAAVVEGDARVKEEAADLIYHLLVLLALRGVSLGEVVRTLESRHEERTARRSKG